MHITVGDVEGYFWSQAAHYTVF